MRGKAFHRAIAMMSAISAVMAAASGNFALQQAGLREIGEYESHGKGGKRPAVRGNGSARVRRAATKARNVRRHRSRA